MTLTQRIGDHVRIPDVFGDEVLDVVMVNANYGRVMVEIPNTDGTGRIVEYFTRWYDADRVEPV